MFRISNKYTCYVFFQYCLPLRNDNNGIIHVNNRVVVRVISSVSVCVTSRKQSGTYKAMALVWVSHLINQTGNVL